MTSLTSSIRHYYNQSVEHEQSIVRVVITMLILFYLFTAPIGKAFGEDPKLISLAIYALTYTFGFIYVIAKSPQANQARRISANVCDVITTSLIMCYAGEYAAPLWAIFVFVTVGNGFRYGVKNLNISFVLSLVGMINVIAFTPYWKEHIPATLLTLFSMTILMFYCRMLISRQVQLVIKAEAANQAKKKFLASMTHEIRTPLNGIKFYHEMLVRETSLSTKQHEYLENANSSTLALARLVDNVLDFSKIEAGKVELHHTPINLRDISRDLRRNFRPALQGKDVLFPIKIHKAVSSSLMCDELNLLKILNNLISNAIKFTPEGSVSLNVDYISETESGQRIRFQVEDTGIGMTQEELGRIFEDFTQANAQTSAKYGGTGLGTTIAKELVEKLGGELNVSSELDRGTRFWFMLDLPYATKSEKTSEGSQLVDLNFAKETCSGLDIREYYLIKGGAPGIKILVAEDNYINQQVVIKILETAGIDVTVVADGDQALDAIEKNKYDMIILDMNMPEYDGLTVHQTIKTLTYGDHTVPTVLLTAECTVDLERRAKEAGIDRFLAKPVESRMLLDIIIQLTTNPTTVSTAADPTQATSLTPVNKIINYEITERLRELEPKDTFYAEIIIRFLQENKRAIHQLDLEITNANWTRFKKDVHDIKSAAALVGAEKMAEICKVINEVPMADLPIEAPDLYSLLSDTANDTKRELMDYISNSKLMATNKR